MILLAGCGQQQPAKPKQAKAEPGKAFKDGPMPDVWNVLFDTSQGSFVVQVNTAWAPKGAAQLWRLVNMGFFDDTRIYRVKPDFIAQFGLSGDPQVNAMLNAKAIDDDPPAKQKNVKGTIAFAQSGPRSRRTQIFVNLKDNPELDSAGFVPLGKVTHGFEVFAKLYAGYGEWDPPGRGPNFNKIVTQGNAYLDQFYPRLDKILRAKAVR